MDNFTVIEDIFDDGGGQQAPVNNQIMAARGFMANTHIPEDMRPRKSLPPSIPIPPLPPKMAYQSEMADQIGCRDVFLHTENCPVCSSYFKKDIKFYWLIILILVLIILFLMRGRKD